jgi:hypothetical protein
MTGQGGIQTHIDQIVGKFLPFFEMNRLGFGLIDHAMQTGPTGRHLQRWNVTRQALYRAHAIRINHFKSVEQMGQVVIPNALEIRAGFGVPDDCLIWVDTIGVGFDPEFMAMGGACQKQHCA